MHQTDELYSLFRRNFPYITREETTARALLGAPENCVFARRDARAALFAACVVHKNAVLMLAVDAGHRRQGVGSALLAQAEEHIRAQGYADIIVGAGDDYICPGVPVREKPFPETLLRENLDPRIPCNNAAFFVRRGYVHSWDGCNCFDMRLSMVSCNLIESEIGDTIDGIRYRWATPEDLPGLLACTDDAEPGFTKYYAAGDYYREDAAQRALLALAGDTICGALIVSCETEAAGLGSIGCTIVSHAWRGRHIASNMIMLGAKSLHTVGMRESYLSYTYSGLDKLYGRAGYAVSTLYFMAKKAL